MVQKFQYTKKKVKVGYPDGFPRYDPRLGRNVHVRPYTRSQEVKVATSDLVVKQQKLEDDWSHRSYEYPNILGLTDKEIETYIKKEGVNEAETRAYIKHIKCLDKDDIRKLSEKAFDKFHKRMIDYNETHGHKKNPYYRDTTIFITSPRGGFDILSDFGYANKLNKKNFPYDLERYEFAHTPTLKAESMPYGESIYDVNDIVFIDDIYMSGEQCHRAYEELDKKIQELNISSEQKPRLHYMAMVGDKNASQGKNKGWDSFTVGEEYSFERDGAKFEEVSAVVFPFSIPDGMRHHTARRLYRTKKRFSHRLD